MINYEYYKVFYYACKYMNFTKAAGALGTSQSSVSHTIQTLEYQLGCRLFTRSNRGIKLTPEGKQLYKYVAAGCEQFIKGENELMSGLQMEQGVVYLAATETALNCFLFNALNDFRSIYPNIKFKIENLTTYSAAEAVKSGVSDFAILSTPLKINKPLVEKKLIEFSDVLIGGIYYKDLWHKEMELSALLDYPYISICSGTATRAFYDAFLEKHKLYITPDIEVATTDMIMPMVKNNMGIGFIPHLMINEEDQEVHIIPLRKMMQKRSINIVYNMSTPKSPAAKTFINFMINEDIRRHES